MNLYYYQTELGKIGIAENNGSITRLFFQTDTVPDNVQLCETDLLKESWRQLAAYLAGDLKEFSLPLHPEGTSFMQQVWKVLCTIPYGTTASYKDVAVAVGRSNAARAVGLANNRNPIPLFIPCHRIIGANGKLVGYRGGLALKEKLLALERDCF